MGSLRGQDLAALEIGEHPRGHGHIGEGIRGRTGIDDHVAAGEQGATDGLRFVQFYFGLPIAMVVISAVFLPRYFRLGVYTAYEYLERRFDLRCRLFASLSFVLFHVGRIALVLYLPALALAASPAAVIPAA